MRKNPKAIYKVLEIAANFAYETTYYNFTGKKRNQTIPFNHSGLLSKKVRDFMTKNKTY